MLLLWVLLGFFETQLTEWIFYGHLATLTVRNLNKKKARDPKKNPDTFMTRQFGCDSHLC